MKNRFSTALLMFLSLALSVSSDFRIGKAAEPDRELLSADDREAIDAIENLGATVRLLRSRKTATDENPPNAIVVIGSKWKGKDEDLKSVAGLATLQSLYVIGPGHVTNRALDKLRDDRPDVTVARRPAVMLGIQPRKVANKKPKDEKGVEIERVERGSPAVHAGIETGDRLTEFNGKAVSDFEELLELMLPLTPGQTVSAKLERDNMTISVTIKFPPTK